MTEREQLEEELARIQIIIGYIKSTLNKYEERERQTMMKINRARRLEREQ